MTTWRDAHARPGQAAARRGLRRGRGARRLLAHGGSRRDASRRLDAALGRCREADPRLPRATRRRRRDHAVELAVHDARRADRSRSRRRERGRLDSRVVDVGLRGEARRVHRRRGASGRRVLDGHRPWRGRRRRGGLEPGDAGGRLHRLDRDGAQGGGGRGREDDCARARRQRPDGRARRRGHRRPRRRRASPRRSFAQDRAARRASSSSCTRPSTTSSSSGFEQRSTARCGSGTRSREETTMGPLNNEPTARKTDEHVADALERGAELVVGGTRASGFPTDLYWQATVLSEVTEEMDIAREETFGPVVPIVRISKRRGGTPDRELLAVRPPHGGLDSRSRPRAALRRSRRRRLGEHQRVDELLGEPPSVRRPRGIELGRRARRWKLGAGGVHRAEDRRCDARLSSAVILAFAANALDADSIFLSITHKETHAKRSRGARSAGVFTREIGHAQAVVCGHERRDPLLPDLKRLRHTGRESRGRDHVQHERISPATPGGHSQFDVVADGVLIFSKHDKGRFPEDGEILRLLSPGADRAAILGRRPLFAALLVQMYEGWAARCGMQAQGSAASPRFGRVLCPSSPPPFAAVLGRLPLQPVDLPRAFLDVPERSTRRARRRTVRAQNE